MGLVDNPDIRSTYTSISTMINEGLCSTTVRCRYTVGIVYVDLLIDLSINHYLITFLWGTGRSGHSVGEGPVYVSWVLSRLGLLGSIDQYLISIRSVLRGRWLTNYQIHQGIRLQGAVVTASM